MGIGALYKNVLEDLRHDVVTVDLAKPADFKSIAEALEHHPRFDCVFICTPNHTHEELAYNLAKHASIVFVEKPGLADADRWQGLVDAHPKTRFMMIKNNQYRNIIPTLKNMRDHVDVVDIRWINYDRVPNPGSWFTDKSKAFGGVSRDLMPHLLSFVTALLPESYQNMCHVNARAREQRWRLSDIKNTAYGTIASDGTYDVDDRDAIEMTVGRTKTYLAADWRSLKVDDQSLQIILDNHERLYFDLGLCPEYAYKEMIRTAVNNISDDDFWKDQLAQDVWIHRMCE
jgi:oxidoreductase